MDTVNLQQKFALFSEHYKPHIIGEVNDCHVKAVKLKGEFIWHHHDNEDELFLVVKGTLRMKFRDHESIIREGEFIIVSPHRRASPHRRRRSSHRAHRAEINIEHRKYHQRKDRRPAQKYLAAESAALTKQFMEHRFHTLDVFTTNRFEGNPLAVITDGDGLSNATMHAIAREMNLSETVFVQKPTDDRALARLRIFTTSEELKLAGHPVVGTWFLLAELGVVPAQEGGVHIMQQTGAGFCPSKFVSKTAARNASP